jgi:putative flippase GtrA
MRFLRFFSVGVLNAAGTLLIYQILVGFLGYVLAYAVSFASGVVFSAAANSRFVFGSQLTLARFARFAIFYCMSFVVSLLFLKVLVEQAGLHPRWAPFIVAAAMAPLNFLGARYFLGGTK